MQHISKLLKVSPQVTGHFDGEVTYRLEFLSLAFSKQVEAQLVELQNVSTALFTLPWGNRNLSGNIISIGATDGGRVMVVYGLKELIELEL